MESYGHYFRTLVFHHSKQFYTINDVKREIPVMNAVIIDIKSVDIWLLCPAVLLQLKREILMKQIGCYIPELRGLPTVVSLRLPTYLDSI